MKGLIAFIVVIILSAQLNASLPFVIKKFDTPHKIVALTFDDGPHKGITPEIMAILEKHDVKASFFFIGNQVEKLPQLSRSVFTAGHTVGNHSYSHYHLEEKNAQFVLKDIAKSQVVFYNSIGYLPSLARSPYGKYELTETYKQHFKHLIGWNIDPRDWDKNESPRSIVKHIMKEVRPGSIILLHESKKTVKLLPTLLKKLKKEGYQLIALHELIGDYERALFKASQKKETPQQEATKMPGLITF